jgi:L-fuculose-phosphate aldolase
MTIIDKLDRKDAELLTAPAQLAVLARALYRVGYDDETCAGHVTYRQPDDTFLTLPDGLGWNEVRTSDVIRVDIDGNTLEGVGTAKAPLLLHLTYHRARPGCTVTVHHHPRFGTVWSATGRIPPVYDQRSANVSDAEIALYNDYMRGVRFADASDAAVEAMGDAKCALLQNHGVFIVGDSIAEIYSRATNFEWRCRQAWFAEAIGATTTMPIEGHRRITEFMAEEYGGIFPHLWEWAVRRELGVIDHVLS